MKARVLTMCLMLVALENSLLQSGGTPRDLGHGMGGVNCIACLPGT